MLADRSFRDREKFTVVIDKIGDAYAEKGAIKARVEPSNALSLDDMTNRIVCRRLSAFRFDLCTSGECDERVAMIVLSITLRGSRKGVVYVSVMERRPPPAPARA